MKLFLDTADIEEVRSAAALGFLDGVTTNPKLVAAAGARLTELVSTLARATSGPVCVPARGDNAEALVADGLALARLHANVVVKVPIDAEGLPAMRRLRDAGVRTHATLCCTPTQALLAAKCGAHYVSPFVGRVEEWGESGDDLVARIVEILDNYEFETQIMVASVRHTAHVERAALLGADACTMPWRVFQGLAAHPHAEALGRAYRDAGRQYS